MIKTYLRRWWVLNRLFYFSTHYHKMIAPQDDFLQWMVGLDISSKVTSWYTGTTQTGWFHNWITWRFYNSKSSKKGIPIEQLLIDFPKEKIENVKNLEEKGLNKENKGREVFFNGSFIGSVENPQEFVRQIIERRRRGELPVQMNVLNNDFFENVAISTEPGRVLRPLIIVDNGISRLKQEHLLRLEQKEMTWEDLIKEEIIE